MKHVSVKNVAPSPAAARAACAAAVCALVTGCAGAVPANPTLERAHRVYQDAKAGPASRVAPVDLNRAEIALERADRLHARDPNSKEANAQAYIALRRAELADVRAHAELAYAARGQSVALALDAASRRVEQLNAELEQAHAQLASALASRAEEPAAPAVRRDARGDVITVPGAVLFALASAEIQPAARETLERVAALLRTVPDRRVVVQGYTDSTGDQGVNGRLSRARADAVRLYLAKRGVDPSRLAAEGLGDREPVATNATPEGRAANRRVEIVVQLHTGAAESMPPSGFAR